ncbi:DUF4352 domain-containing protein [Kibdelosporangium phytohabitans]|uniref:DUF4352 domain-containing protein n=1 Tax=Kibdelosporangium phytohabitans TaxID=860235 RepID=A0A0N9I7Z5_9PSEU|nr:DUF4352 domain-containing protein [Kibdelosporangium phytohabitans]ALG10747.1 hypothetical protein AOZ06_31090 [Kibdelosporangium phytohabitans]MBE1461895.1 hypothetical protein [Kibdelosporangium phytohabitans]
MLVRVRSRVRARVGQDWVRRGQAKPREGGRRSLTLSQKDGSAVVTLISVSESFQGDRHAKAPQSGNFVAVDVRLEHKAGGNYRVNTLDFKVRVPDGKAVSFNDGSGRSAMSSDRPIPAGTQLTAGESVGGAPAFDVEYDPKLVLLALDVNGLIVGQWPLSGGEPVMGDGAVKKEIDKSLTHKVVGDTASVTLVSVAESKGGVDPASVPQSGSFVVAELKYEAKAGNYYINSTYLKLQKSDGPHMSTQDGNRRTVCRPRGLPVGQARAGQVRHGQSGLRRHTRTGHEARAHRTGQQQGPAG